MSSEVTPSLEAWLALPADRLAETVRGKHLAILFSVDGTRRHYLINTGKEQITDFADFAEYSAHSYVRAYDLLYALGIETVMTPLLYPPNFRRSEAYLKESLSTTRRLLTTSPFSELYERWKVRVRLYGDYDIASAAASTRERILGLARTLQVSTFEGPRRLLFGYCAGSFSQEAISRAVRLNRATNRIPTDAEVRAACFPDGPEAANIYIGAGWLRSGLVLPPVLDGGQTDLYVLNHLALDLQEVTLRQILYDHLYRRWAGPEDDADYTPEDLQALRTYYARHPSCVTGLGHLVGPGLWYADHQHEATDTI